MLTFALSFPNIGPDIISIPIGSFTFALRWYAMAYIVGILLAWWLMVKVSQTARLWPDGAPITRDQIDDFMTWVILGVIIGGRLGYVLFYDPARYWAAPQDIIKVWQGGMAFHGGFLGVVVAALVFAKRNNVSPLSMADIMAVATPFSLFLGRSANFINGELWGAPTTVPWGVIFPGRAAQDCGQAIGELCARHPSQLYEGVLEGLLLGAILLLLVLRAGALKRPGLIAGLFFIGYGISRFVVEFVRQADDQFITPDNPLGHVVRLGEAGLSMGQVLSLPMIIVGLLLVAFALARNDRA